MKILITGGTGFVGNHLVEKLENHHQLFLLTNQRLSSKSNRKIKYIYQDLTRPLNLSVKNIDAIIFLAQGNQTFPNGAITEFKVNTVSTLELLEWGRTHKIKRFLYASTGGVYGFGPQIFREQDLPHSKNFYEGTKIAAESLIWQYRMFFSCIIMRFSFPYGPKMAPQRLFARLIANINTGKPITIKNEGNPKINPVYIDDLTIAIGKLLKFKESIILNLAGEKAYSIKEIALKIGKILGKKPVFRYLEEQPRNMNLVCDTGLAKSLIDFQATISLEEGLKRTIECAE